MRGINLPLCHGVYSGENPIATNGDAIIFNPAMLNPSTYNLNLSN